MKEKIKGLLRKSEKYTKTDMVYLAKGGASLTGATVALAFFSFLLSIAFANLITQEAYGVYRFMLSAAAVIGTFTLSGIGLSVSRAVSRGRSGILHDAARSLLTWNVIPFLIATGASGWYFFQGNGTLAFAMALIAVLTPISTVLSLHDAWFSGMKEFEHLAASRIAQGGLRVIVLVILLLLTDNPLLLLGGYFFTQIVVSAIFFAIIVKRFPKEPFAEEDRKYSMHLTAMNFVANLATHIDKIIVFHFLGATSTAVYVFAQALPDQLRSVAKNIGSLALPKLAEKNISDARRGMRRKSLILTGVFGCSAIAYAFVAPHLFLWFFPAYLDAVPYSQVISVNILLTGLALLPNTLLTAQAAVKEKYLLGFLTPGLRILLMLALVIPYGIWGIVAALLISKTLGTLLILYLARKAK